MSSSYCAKWKTRSIVGMTGQPYIFTMKDYDMLINSNKAIFARKFDEEVDFKVVEVINKLTSQL